MTKIKKNGTECALKFLLKFMGGLVRPRKIALSSRGIYEVIRSEEDVIREITDMFDLNGIQWWRSVERIPKRGWRGQIVGRCETAGLPDLLCLADGYPFWIEVKGPEGRLRPAQEDFLKAFQEAGLCAFMARSWEEVRKVLLDRGVRLKV